MCQSYIKSYDCGHSALGHRFCEDSTENVNQNHNHNHDHNSNNNAKPGVLPPSSFSLDEEEERIPCPRVGFTLDLAFPPGPCPGPSKCAFGRKGRGWKCCQCGMGGNSIGSCAGRDGAGLKCCHVCCEGCQGMGIGV
ncbi:hypothetical protein F4809DRAFT_657638 [Biscogniauxia mediterranea]|nr:hypothetical protein F4809DRAFT_657638 [Biscogniauxia mediterranea]